MSLLANLGLMRISKHKAAQTDLVAQANKHMATQIEICSVSVDETLMQIIDASLETKDMSFDRREPVVIRFEFPFSFVRGLSRGSQEVAEFVMGRLAKIIGRKLMDALDQGQARSMEEGGAGTSGNYL
jgi:hypothetical protein